MNLIEDEWIPVVLHSGIAVTIAPASIARTDDPPMRLSFARPDWNLAGLELLIGLLYLSAPPEDEDDWHERAGEHDPATLAERLAPLTHWFSLDAGEGPRFLQDLEPLGSSLLPCDRLLVDAPGEKAVKDNTDVLVKRSSGLMLSRATAAIALYTLQQFAPAGGAGNRTSMRGGGPMVTLVEPTPRGGPMVTLMGPTPRASLMEIVWANVPAGRPLDTSDAKAVAAALPWTAPTITSGVAGATVHDETVDGGPCAQVYFGMPRRIRLEFGDEVTPCSLTGFSDERPVVGFRQQKHGVDYGQWTHPNTPYYRIKEGSEALPVHPKPGRFGFRQYRGVVLRDSRSNLRTRAACVDTYEAERQDEREPARLIVGGWAMDNMKALDFVLTTEPAPLSRLSEVAERRVVRAIEGAEIVAGILSIALKNALEVEEKATGAVSMARRRFYELSDGAFHRLMHALTSDPEDASATEEWRKRLLSTALHLFDEATSELVALVTPERARTILDGRRLILSTGNGYSKSGKSLFDRLDLDPPETKSRKSKAKETTA